MNDAVMTMNGDENAKLRRVGTWLRVPKKKLPNALSNANTSDINSEISIYV